MSDTQVDRAMQEASSLREKASLYQQMGWPLIARFCLENAKAAERWAVSIARLDNQF